MALENFFVRAVMTCSDPVSSETCDWILVLFAKHQSWLDLFLKRLIYLVNVKWKGKKKTRKYAGFCLLFNLLIAKHPVSLRGLFFNFFCFYNFQNSGQIAPLDEIIKLKEKYKFRVLLDESNSLGVLGSSGKGLTEYYNVPVCY